MITTEHVKFAYSGMDAVLKDVCMDEASGHCLALLGNNGAGKSTFLKCLNRILDPAGGLIMVDGMEISHTPRREIAQKLAYVEQRTDSSRLTVYDTVLLGRKPHMKYGVSNADYQIVDNAIARMHLEPFKLRYIDELSGGELQKVILARALAQQPKVLLLDEPTASLDLKNQHEVMRIVTQIARDDNITVIIVIHDLNLALKYCDHFLLIHDGLSFRFGDSSIITPETIREVYGVEASVLEIEGCKTVLVKG